MRVIGKGGVELGELLLNAEGRKILTDAAYRGKPMQIAFDCQRVTLRDNATGEVTGDTIELTMAAIAEEESR